MEKRKVMGGRECFVYVEGYALSASHNLPLPRMEKRKVMGGRESITFNIDEALFKRSLKSVFVAMSDFQMVDPRWQRSRLKKLSFPQDEIRHSSIVKLTRILHLPAHESPLFCELRQHYLV